MAGLGAAGGWSRLARAAPAAGPAELRRALTALVHPMAPEDLARPDGFVHAADLALLALTAALEGDRERYQQLLRMAQRRFFVPGPSGQGRTVLRRRRLMSPVSRPALAGASEGLQWAQAVLTGARVLGRDADARLGLQLLDGYLAYATELDTRWMIRTSYDVGARRFSDLSSLADYGPDLLNYVASHRDAERFRRAGMRALALMHMGQRSNGLIDAFMQPEIQAHTGSSHFSPNGIVQLRDDACVAEQAAVGAPELTGRLLRFVEPRLGSLRAAYDVSTGQPHGLEPADVGTLAILARAAVKTGDDRFLEHIRPLLVRHASWLIRQEGTLDIQALAQTGLALQFIEAKEARKELPASIPCRQPRRV